MADMEFFQLDLRAYVGEGSPEEIESAIALCEWRDEEDPGGEQARDMLVATLLDLFESGSSRYHLDSALNLAQELYELGVTIGNDNRQTQRASNYAKALGHRYWEDGDPEDLHKAIKLSDEAVSASPQARSILGRPRGTILLDPSIEIHALNTLAARLEERFQMAGSLGDLDRSIDIRERLIAAVPWEEWQASRAEWLLNLAASLQRRYEQDEGDSRSDIDRAVELSEEALSYASDNSLLTSRALCTLANALGGRAGVTQQANDLDRAIQSLREAQEKDPTNHASALEIGVNLAMRLFQRYEMTDSETMTDLDKAMDVARSTLDGTPDDHPMNAHLQNFLGLFLYARFCRSASESVAEEALGHFRQALRSPHYPSVFHRVQAGRIMLRICCDMARWQEAYEASLEAIELIPKLSSRAIRISDKQRLLSADDVVGFGADAAAAALLSGQDGYAALRLLEMGRQSLAASVAELRPDLVALRRDYPELAERVDSLRDELQDDSPRQHAASGEFDALLDEIRQKEGFERFLEPPSNEEIHEAARGHLIVLTVSAYRGVDAILIERDRVHVLNLNGVTLEDLEKWSRNLQRPAVLRWLWDSIAKPVLDELRLTRPSPDGCLPRIWWIPTGILSRFPFHAAGYHSKGLTDSVIDLAVSSYSSSIKALVDGRRRASSLPRPKESKALLVAIANAPNRSLLRGAVKEVQTVEALFASKDFDSVRLGDSRVHKQDVLQRLKTCQIFHFAGHGVENISDPLRSALLLHDWETDPLTVGDVLEVNLSDGNPFLAYLSACETGQVSKSKFRDESVHLIGAYQLAGFRHVIGTLWVVDDDDSVMMATATYENMLEDMTDESVCRSLHKAALRLRNDTRLPNVGADQSGARKCVFVDSSADESGEDGASWIPFVHFGV
ncbi:CHAT domain-containing protein [Fusarium falciforme]|uniref:CHAT domain-containing protein n=1 Tax=Fusarium falciforme TaxID=195108 RepID=UPI0023014BDD|nr:CHAT domain-containing protein [Fusarium falciforme]WAO94169.1 CHAT domain-containing protein [Fusarium falciforme]